MATRGIRKGSKVCIVGKSDCGVVALALPIDELLFLIGEAVHTIARLDLSSLKEAIIIEAMVASIGNPNRMVGVVEVPDFVVPRLAVNGGVDLDLATPPNTFANVPNIIPKVCVCTTNRPIRIAHPIESKHWCLGCLIIRNVRAFR